MLGFMAVCCAGENAAAVVVRIAVWPGQSDDRCTSRPQLAADAERALSRSPLQLLPVRARSPSRPLAVIPQV